MRFPQPRPFRRAGMTLKNLVDRFIDPKPTVARAVDRYVARERRKEKRRFERRKREIRKIARKIKDFDPWNL